MKIAILNYSGNVGKTTLARDLFKYRLPDYELITIESVNSDGEEDMIIRGEDGDKIYEELLLNDNIILDIGSSNLESFFKTTEKEFEIIKSIDMFVIPSTQNKKQQQDTLKTLNSLIHAGVNLSNIHVIGNQVIREADKTLEESFDTILSAKSKLFFNFDLNHAIERHDLGERKLADIISDVDYRSKMEEAKLADDKEKARKYAQKYIRQKKIHSLNKHYQMIFNKLMG